MLFDTILITYKSITILDILIMLVVEIIVYHATKIISEGMKLDTI
jgi:hypothetical protein